MGYPAGCNASPTGGIVCAPGVDPFGELHLGSGPTVPGYDFPVTSLSPQAPAIPAIPAMGVPNASTVDVSGTPLSTYIPGNSTTETAPQTNAQATPVSTAGTASLSDFLTIVSDLPRMATIFVGFVLLIIGLAMLGSRPAVQIVQKVAPKVAEAVA